MTHHCRPSTIVLIVRPSICDKTQVFSSFHCNEQIHLSGLCHVSLGDSASPQSVLELRFPELQNLRIIAGC
jgi:hypothetical protein